MIPLSTAISGGLTWKKIPHSRNYELKTNGELVGTLQRTSIWSSSFIAETRDGAWTFRRTGFLGTRAEVLEAEIPIATFKSAWASRGVLTLTDGQTFHVECRGCWHPAWSVTTEDGKLILRIRSRERSVEVPMSSAVNSSRLSLLIMFTWYRLLQAEEDAAAAAAAIAS